MNGTSIQLKTPYPSVRINDLIPMSRLTPDSHQILHLLCTRLNALQGITSTPNLTLFLASVCSDWLALTL